MCEELELLQQAEEHADRLVELSDSPNHETQGKALVALTGNDNTLSEPHRKSECTVSDHVFPVDVARQFLRASHTGVRDASSQLRADVKAFPAL